MVVTRGQDSPGQETTQWRSKAAEITDDESDTEEPKKDGNEVVDKTVTNIATQQENDTGVVKKRGRPRKNATKDSPILGQLEEDGGNPANISTESATESRIKRNPRLRKRSYEPDESDSPETNRSIIKCTSILIILFILIIGSSSYVLYSKEIELTMFEIKEYIGDMLPRREESVNENLDPLTPWDTFKRKFKEEFTPKYLNAVPKSSIKVIKAAVKDVMVAYENDEEIDKLSPSVILILGKEGNKNFTCFVRDLERMISSAYNEANPVRLKGESVDSKGIEDAFNEVFKDKKQHLIVIDGLNKLDGKSAAHLHRFTDHE